jgi:ribosomal protein S18 acetylase RimI-like enzyme
MTTEKEKFTSLVVTDAMPANAKAIGDVTFDVWMATYPNAHEGITEDDIRAKFQFATPEDETTSIEERAKRISNERSRHYWVAKDGTKIVGYCVAQKGDQTNIFQALNILPDYQGGGLGRRFMEKALAWLDNDRPVSLRVLSYNRDAIGFYERFGFVQTGRTVEVPNELPNGKVIPRVEMVKKQQL